MWWLHKALSYRLSAFSLAGSRKLKAVSCFALVFLAACGFHPMYGEDSLDKGATPLKGNIAIDAVGGGHEGQMLRIALEDRFNPEGLSTNNALYHLSVTLNKQLVPSVVKSDGTIQRYDVRFYSEFKLLKVGVDAPILTGNLRRIGSYNTAVNANFATYEAEQDVIQRLIEDLAEEYVMRVSDYLAARPDPGKPASGKAKP